jgi:hypothetical protein
MLFLSKLFKDRTGQVLMSVLLGLGLATLFRSVCKGSKCQIERAPDDLNDPTAVYQHDGKCYTLQQESITCDASKETVKA